MEHLLSRKRPFRDKTPATQLRSFFQYLFARGQHDDELIALRPEGPRTLGRKAASLPIAG
ncbi:hypothetical protein ACFKHW_29980 [Bradyrhizobium lupini]|uniref:hypothetical protein n=1 Tax=Rhizobium lupini TaxID=136996 RepID=UPI00366AA7F8